MTHRPAFYFAGLPLPGKVVDPVYCKLTQVVPKDKNKPIRIGFYYSLKLKTATPDPEAAIKESPIDLSRCFAYMRALYEEARLQDELRRELRYIAMLREPDTLPPRCESFYLIWELPQPDVAGASAGAFFQHPRKTALAKHLFKYSP